MPPRASSRVNEDRVIQPFPEPVGQDGELELAKAVNRLADVFEEGFRTIEPAVEAVHSLGDAQKRFCAFLVGNRVKIILGIPTILAAVGAISPNGAKMLAGLLAAAGVQ